METLSTSWSTLTTETEGKKREWGGIKLVSVSPQTDTFPQEINAHKAPKKGKRNSRILKLEFYIEDIFKH